MSVLLRHIDRQAALRLALSALPEAWPEHPREVVKSIVSARSIDDVERAVDAALAALPDISFCHLYPPIVGEAVEALTETRRSTGVDDVCADVDPPAPTPGPWHMSPNIDGTSDIMSDAAPSKWIAVTPGGAHRCVADARLIAAAPELLAVALRVAEHFQDTDAPLGELARAALLKVQGPTETNP